MTSGVIFSGQTCSSCVHSRTMCPSHEVSHTRGVDLNKSLTELDWLSTMELGGQLTISSVSDNEEDKIIPGEGGGGDKNTEQKFMSASDSLSNYCQNMDGLCNSDQQDPYEKPLLSYCTMIRMAINASPQKRLPLVDIYSWLCEKFPYFQKADPSWKNSVRHNLSVRRCFHKLPKEGKGSYWCVISEKAQEASESCLEEYCVPPEYKFDEPIDVKEAVCRNKRQLECAKNHESEGNNVYDISKKIKVEPDDTFDWSSVIKQDVNIGGYTIKSESESYDSDLIVPKREVGENVSSCINDTSVFPEELRLTSLDTEETPLNSTHDLSRDSESTGWRNFCSNARVRVDVRAELDPAYPVSALSMTSSKYDCGFPSNDALHFNALGGCKTNDENSVCVLEPMASWRTSEVEESLDCSSHSSIETPSLSPIPHYGDTRPYVVSWSSDQSDLFDMDSLILY